MGAYENPLAVIDTESSKIWANAIKKHRRYNFRAY